MLKSPSHSNSIHTPAKAVPIDIHPTGFSFSPKIFHAPIAVKIGTVAIIRLEVVVVRVWSPILNTITYSEKANAPSIANNQT